MYIYNYDKTTNEYSGQALAEADPVETQKTGHFVPLIPAYSTTIAVPEYLQNQIPVWENNSWVVKSDYREQWQVELTTKKVSKIVTIGDLNVGFQLVSVETALDISKNPDKYEVVAGILTDISDTPEYKEKIAQKRKQNWESQFINTPFGWLRINTTSGDLLSLLNSFETVARVRGKIPAETLLFYSTPDYTKELTDEYLKSLQHWNEILSYSDFQTIFDAVVAGYLERFKGE